MSGRAPPPFVWRSRYAAGGRIGVRGCDVAGTLASRDQDIAESGKQA